MAPRDVVPLAERYRAALEALRAGTARYVLGQWQALSSWSDAAAEAFLANVVPVVMASRTRSAALTAAYMGAATGVQPKIDPTLTAWMVRNGADPYEVYGRAVVEARAVYAKKTAAKTAEDVAADLAQSIVDDAFNIGARRLAGAVDLDVSRAASYASQDVLRQAGTDTYRTATRPGACELCIVASARTYHTSELQPLHTNCHCIVVPGSRIPRGLRGDNTLQTTREYADGEARGREVVVGFNDELGPTLDYKDAAETVARRRRNQAARKAGRPVEKRNAPAIDPRSREQKIADKRAQIAANQSAIDRGADTDHMRRLVGQYRDELTQLLAS